MRAPLVVVEEIDVESSAVLEAENDPPIPADSDGPEALQVAFERVQAKTGEVEGSRRLGSVKRGENALDFTAQRCVDPARVTTFVEPFESAMPNAPDHSSIVK